jgi:NTE family protein
MALPPDTEHALPLIEIFAHLDTAEMVELAARFETRSLKRGEAVIRQGEPADALYIVVSGRFAVTVAGRRAPIAEIGPDQPIGEITFITGGGQRTATVTAMRDSIVLRLGRTDFEQLSRKHPMIWRSLAMTLARRLADTTAAAPAPPDPRPRTIAIIRAGDSPQPTEFITKLTEVFKTAGRTLVLDSQTVPGAVKVGARMESAAATRALNALEAGNEYIVFVADAEVTAWSEKAIRHADLVLAVGQADADPTPNALENLAARFVAPDASRLVLVHPRRQRISGTARWLKPRHVAMHHHVAMNEMGDMARLYRFISGTARGLVACGGGALCAAHVGIYQALQETGYEFDIVGGTSAGSAMVAAFALGTPTSAIGNAIHDIFVANRAMSRYTLPRYSLLDHANFDAQLRRYFGGIDIEDLWLPFYAVSTNLSRYKLHVHRHGDLWTAVRASASIPVLLPPIYTADGEMLVDGALLDNVPIGPMHELKSGPNVVVSFLLADMDRFDVDYGSLPSRAELMRLAINPLRRNRLPQAPGLATVLMRSLMANRQDYHRHIGGDDLLLVPPIPADIGFLDWQRHGELIGMGHAWTLNELARRQEAGTLGFSPG